jgi:subtilisin family serine protease
MSAKPVVTIAAALLLLAVSAWGQAPPDDWFLKDPDRDKIVGSAADKAYDLIKGRKASKVIVAVIDGGVDIGHEDLKDYIWTNAREVAGNGLDDDKNGFVDDLHGWNFIGGPGGSVEHETNELTREYARLKKKYEGRSRSEVPVPEQSVFDEWEALKKRYESERAKTERELELFESFLEMFESAADRLTTLYPGVTITIAVLDTLTTDDEVVRSAITVIRLFMERQDPGTSLASVVTDLREGTEYYRDAIQYTYNPDYDPRSIVGDDPANVRENFYGNNDVAGPDPRHGTHVAGIIAANRGNSLGIRGIADQVVILPVRAVPDGDERDKDVANAIRYAADNGARIINMSFGKELSPDKELVDEAVRYAQSKGALLVHSAGNEGEDLGHQPDYPARTFLDGTTAANWIEVGASYWLDNEEIACSFSNYSRSLVDLFAPGKEIYSCFPDNSYGHLNGTSMAAPVVSGVAALLWSYFPALTAAEVRDIILDSVTSYKGLNVARPGSDEKVSFDDLSRTGGIVNAYSAVQAALAREKNKRK